jgi:GDPmannose 4,6-dehydratase
MKDKKALIFGVSGQDGAYLSRFLLNKDYKVFGTSRDSQICPFNNLHQLGIREKVITLSAAINDFRSVIQVLKEVKPDEIYNLSGQTSVGLSFEQPVETIESISGGTLNLLEAIRFLGEPIKFYNACSSECFGDTGLSGADERTPFRPHSPYAVAKASAFWLVDNYRQAYNLFACSGILFNHESPLRPARFVTKKIVSTACRITCGSQERLVLGDLDVKRDWGWAPEYVEAMWMMLQKNIPSDYVIATGRTHSLRDFIVSVFKCLGLDWQQHVDFNPSLLRPVDIRTSCGIPEKARRELDWKACYAMQDIVTELVKYDLELAKRVSR